MGQTTAIEWLFKQLWDEPKDKMVWYAILDKAKEMEKEQIVEVGNFCQKQDFHSVIIADSVNGPTRDIISIGEHYYKKTYGKETDSN
jgi:hypothetical protein